MSAVRHTISFVLTMLVLAMTINAASAQAIISGNYYEESKSKSCSAGGNSACNVIFSATPPTGMLIITDVSCLFGHTQTIVQSAIAVSDSATSGPFRRFEFFPVQTGGTQQGVIFSAAKFKTNFLFGQGKYPAVYFNMVTVGTGSIDCKIVGLFQPNV